MPDQPPGLSEEPIDVCLLSMPFPVLTQPSMALGLLKATLQDTGLSAKNFYPCLDFAAEVGLDVYNFISGSKQEYLAGEWTFAGVAFPDFEPDHEAYLDDVLSTPVARGLLRRSRFGSEPRQALQNARRVADRFVEGVARQVLAHQPKIVGCTSTFMQHGASLALLRKIRDLAPEVVTLVGGANCEGEMGVATRRCFPWIDFVVSGEADVLFPELCLQIVEHGRDIPASELSFGVIGADHPSLAVPDPEAAGIVAPRASVDRMDRTPIPDFDDYFAALESSPLREFISPSLPVETSRGCWWGQKHHCTFCGLNGGNMAFRSKSPDRVIDEFGYLSEKYGLRKFNVVDNILDMGYIQKLLPRLVMEEPYTLFFETKVNLRRSQLEAIAAAGIRRLQPGVENMHDEILRLVAKGTTALQNIQLLKWAREIGVFITWNFLWDVPGEQDDWYGEMADWLPLVTHLQPPGVDRIQFHRFSPYHQRPEDFGLSLEPFPTHRYVYPVAVKEMQSLAYYFDDLNRRPASEELERRPQLKQVMRNLAQWNRLWGQGGLEGPASKPVLRVLSEPEGLRIEDTRPSAAASSHLLVGLARRVYEACDSIQTPQSVLKAVAGEDPSVSADRVAQVLGELEERRVLLRLNGKVLALGLQQVSRIPDTREEFPAGYVDIEGWNRSAAAVGCAPVA